MLRNEESGGEQFAEIVDPKIGSKLSHSLAITVSVGHRASANTGSSARFHVSGRVSYQQTIFRLNSKQLDGFEDHVGSRFCGKSIRTLDVVEVGNELELF